MNARRYNGRKGSTQQLFSLERTQEKTANTSQSYYAMKHSPMLTGGDFWAVNRSHKSIKFELQSIQER